MCTHKRLMSEVIYHLFSMIFYINTSGNARPLFLIIEYKVNKYCKKKDNTVY